MIITSIRFTEKQAKKYGLKRKDIGKPGCGGLPDHYSLSVFDDIINIKGYTIVEYLDHPELKTKRSQLLGTVSKMIQAGDFVKEYSGIYLFDTNEIHP